MKLNVTRNLSHDSSTLLTVTPHLPNNMNGSRFNLPASRPSVGPKCAATNIVNGELHRIQFKFPRKLIIFSLSFAARVVTPTVPSGNRPRKLPVAVKSESAATSRSNSSASSIGRPAVISKLASVKRAATNVANRTVGSTSALRSSSNAANGLTLNKSRLAANSSMASRRNSAAAMNVSSLATTGAPALNPRRSVGSIKPLKPPVILVSKKWNPEWWFTLNIPRFFLIFFYVWFIFHVTDQWSPILSSFCTFECVFSFLWTIKRPCNTFVSIWDENKVKITCCFQCLSSFPVH